MDNQNKIKYKEAGNGWFIKIFLDDEGNEQGRTASFADGKGSGTGLTKEMQDWIDAGNEVEPQYTAEEQAAKDQADADAAAIVWIGNREAEYNKEGCTIKALIVALWERIIEGRPEASDALEIKRQAVKIKYPKPA